MLTLLEQQESETASEITWHPNKIWSDFPHEATLKQQSRNKNRQQGILELIIQIQNWFNGLRNSRKKRNQEIHPSVITTVKLALLLFVSSGQGIKKRTKSIVLFDCRKIVSLTTFSPSHPHTSLFCLPFCTGLIFHQDFPLNEDEVLWNA